MNYLDHLKEVIEKLHQCEATHSQTVHVVENFQGTVVWEGMVEVFKLKNHPKAVTCYAWSTKRGKEDKVTTVLGISPVDSPLTAVRVAIVKEAKDKK